MHDNAPHLTRIATIAAFIGTAAAIIAGIAWTQAIGAIAPTKDVSAYRAFRAMTNSVWTFSGHASGWEILLIGCAVLKTLAFPKTPGWLCILTGIFRVRIPIPFLNVDPIVEDLRAHRDFQAMLQRLKLP